MNGLFIPLALLSLAVLPREQVVYVPGWHRCARGKDEALRFVAVAFSARSPRTTRHSISNT